MTRLGDPPPTDRDRDQGQDQARDPVDIGRRNQEDEAALWLAGSRLSHFHVCAFVNSQEEARQLLTPYLVDTLAKGEQWRQVLPSDQWPAHRARLDEAGVPVAACETCGQLSLHDGVALAIDEHGGIDRARLMEAVARWTHPHRGNGWPRVRIVADMGSLRQAAADPSELMIFEAEVNDVLARHRQPAICVYDIATLDGATMMDLLRTHPMTWIAGVLRENPFYTPPAEMLRELAARRAARGSRPSVSIELAATNLPALR